jgi:hypothetical protein
LVPTVTARLGWRIGEAVPELETFDTQQRKF